MVNFHSDRTFYTPLPHGRNNTQLLCPFARRVRNCHFLPHAFEGKKNKLPLTLPQGIFSAPTVAEGTGF